MTEYTYKVGDEVEAHDWSGTGRWRPCRITQLAPLHFRSGAIPGYYIQWLDVALGSDPETGIMPSQGGWESDNTLRRAGHVYVCRYGCGEFADQAAARRHERCVPGHVCDCKRGE